MPRQPEQHVVTGATNSHGHGHGLERPLYYLKRAGVAASYPLRGIWYFSSKREFWPLFLSRLVPLSLLSFLVYMILFTFAFLPQYAFLAIFHGWGAWVNAVVLVLGEGLVIVQGLFEGFFVDESRVDVFDVSLILSSELSSSVMTLTNATTYQDIHYENVTNEEPSQRLRLSKSAGSNSSHLIEFSSRMPLQQ